MFAVRIGLFFTLIFPAISFGDDPCLNWFKESGLKPGSNGCVLNCDVLPKDMSTFTCANRCDEFCKMKKCIPDLYWKNQFKVGRPLHWSAQNEITSRWSEAEKDQLMRALNQLPDDLKKVDFDGFYRMKKSVDIINPATTDGSGKSIVVYDIAFENPSWSTSNVITHELGHVIFLNMSRVERQKYSASLGWNKSLGSDETRAGEFVSSRAKDNPNEDFAENFSFFLVNPNTLKTKVPEAHKWFVGKLSSHFKLKEDCKKWQK